MNYEYILFKEVFVVISTGIIRKVDKLGRFVLPSELREKFHIVENDALEIFTSGDMIVLKKYEARDIFTGQSENLIDSENHFGIAFLFFPIYAVFFFIIFFTNKGSILMCLSINSPIRPTTLPIVNAASTVPMPSPSI